MKRVANLIILDGKVLIGHAPNKKFGFQTWDLLKGHVDLSDYKDGTISKSLRINDEEEKALINCGIRELKEETGIRFNDLDGDRPIALYGPYRYNLDELYFLELEISKNKLQLQNMFCSTYFHLKGRSVPEIIKYDFVKKELAHEYLYPRLGVVFQDFLEDRERRCGKYFVG